MISSSVLPLSVWFGSGVGGFVVRFRDKASPRNLTVERGRFSLHIMAERGKSRKDGFEVGSESVWSRIL